MGGQKISDALMGCLEIPIFIKAGIERFENTKQAAKLSFLVPVLILPLGAYLAQLNPEFDNYSFFSLLLNFTLEFILFSLIYLVAVFAFTKQMDRQQFFYRFVNAQNWLSLTQICILLPVLIGVQSGRWVWEEIYNFQVFLIVYSYIFMAFLITYTFKTNWMLGASLSILGMAVSQSIHGLIY